MYKYEQQQSFRLLLHFPLNTTDPYASTHLHKGGDRASPATQVSTVHRGILARRSSISCSTSGYPPCKDGDFVHGTNLLRHQPADHRPKPQFFSPRQYVDYQIGHGQGHEDGCMKRACCVWKCSGNTDQCFGATGATRGSIWRSYVTK
jgi:hypothetical protein